MERIFFKLRAIYILRNLFERDVPELRGKLDGIIAPEEFAKLEGEALQEAFIAMGKSFDVILYRFAEQSEGELVGEYNLFAILNSIGANA